MSTEVAKLESLDMAEAQQDVQKYKVILEQMKADYLPVLDIPINDKKQLDVVKAARINFKNTRLEGVSRLDAGCRALYANWKLWVKARDTFEKEFEDVEALFREKEKAYEDAEERRVLEEAKAHAERMEARRQAVYDTGFTFNGSHYICDRENGEQPWVLSEDQITGLNVNEALLFTFLDQCAAELKATREIKAEAEAKAEEERLAKEAAQKAEADRIAAAQAELERKQREMEEKERQMNARIIQSRVAELVAIGALDEAPPGYIGAHGTTVRKDGLATMDEVAFGTLRELMREKHRAMVEQQDLFRQQQEQERIAREEALKAEAAQKAVEAERMRLAQEQEAKEEAQKLLEEQERDKALRASDREKVIAFGTKMSNLTGEIPELKSAIGQHAMRTLDKQLTDIVTMLAKLEL